MRPTLLYVDDQQSHQLLFKKAFQATYEVLTATSGEEAIEILRENDVFLVIADHNMPRMTGIDLLEKTKDLCPKAQQAILSAYTNDEIVKEAHRRTRVNQFFTKPWKWDRMKSFIEEAYQSYCNQLPAAEQVSEKVDVCWSSLLQMVEKELSGQLETREARRVFLNHVQPPLRDFVPLIRRPTHPLIQCAQQAAIKGRFDEMQAFLLRFFLEWNLSLKGYENLSAKNPTT